MKQDLQAHNHIEVARKRKKSGCEEDSLEFLWAVSYSDMLMVLVSFFIIYFNINAVEKERSVAPIDQLKFMLHEKLNAQEMIPSTGKVVVPDNPEKIIQAKIGKIINGINRQISVNEETRDHTSLLMTDLKNLEKKEIGVETVPFKGIVIDFPDNIYELGQFELNDKVENDISLLLDTLKSYQDNFNFVFIGHSDSMPLKASRKIIKDNLTLSSLRAIKAVELAISKGINPMWVSAQGMDKYSRSTRSLSLRIIER